MHKKAHVSSLHQSQYKIEYRTNEINSNKTNNEFYLAQIETIKIYLHKLIRTTPIMQIPSRKKNNNKKKQKQNKNKSI